MEQSKLISVIIARLKIAYPYYFKELTMEELAGLVSMYQEELGIYNELTLMNAIKSIIRKNKFIPTLKELIDECENFKSYKKNNIIEKMRADGYFKRCVVGELDDMHAIRNYEKTLMWLEKGIIPSWLLEDMKNYGYVDENSLTTNSTNSLLNYGGGSNDN